MVCDDVSMSDIHSISLYLDESLVDELWTLAKRDGTVVEKVKEASAKVGGKAKFGLGKLWQWMTADIEAELSGELSGKYSQKLAYTSVFRALILPELIADIARISDRQTSVGELDHGDFVEIELDTVELVPLPTFAGFLKQAILSGVEDDQADERAAVNFERARSFAETLTGAERALTFYMRATGDYKSPLLERLYNKSPDELFNALCMSKDDHVLALMESGSGISVLSVLEERYLKRNLAAFTVRRPMRVFGRVARPLEDGSIGFLGMEAISVVLS